MARHILITNSVVLRTSSNKLRLHIVALFYGSHRCLIIIFHHAWWQFWLRKFFFLITCPQRARFTSSKTHELQKQTCSSGLALPIYERASHQDKGTASPTHVRKARFGATLAAIARNMCTHSQINLQVRVPKALWCCCFFVNIAHVCIDSSRHTHAQRTNTECYKTLSAVVASQKGALSLSAVITFQQSTCTHWIEHT